ncbi:PREDICTED: transcription factor MYB1R1-like [Tarenaya hassleriana]|uniref:transcription factor MYB1R1-like n=1 Tax=Tarenaya hassleriana TaxID=28532 RepID=UPI00053CA5AF|nr:PREDICTED: transcription factor MYB1R1-like [Tarenaya hassleriana]
MAAGSSSSSETGGGGVRKEIMLFGVRVVVDPMRKCVSLNNLSEYEQPEEIPKKIGGGDGDGEGKNKADFAVGYASADEAVPISSSSGGNRERKRGIPWTEEEHKLFLLGLQKVGKGDWKGISRNFVKTRTPTQVASHAQKYFLRRSNFNRRRRRSSLFDITTETVTGMAMEEDHVQVSHPKDTQPNFVHLVSSTLQAPSGFNLNPAVNSSPLSLSLSLAAPCPKDQQSANCSAFRTTMPSFSSRDSNSVIGVA